MHIYIYIYAFIGEGPLIMSTHTHMKLDEAHRWRRCTSILLSRSLHSCTKQSLVPYRKYTTCGGGGQKRRLQRKVKLFVPVATAIQIQARWRGVRVVCVFKGGGGADLVDDAAGEEGRRLLAVGVEVERHQSIGPHGEVVVHGQDLRTASSVSMSMSMSVCVCVCVCVCVYIDKRKNSNSPWVYGSRGL